MKIGRSRRCCSIRIMLIETRMISYLSELGASARGRGRKPVKQMEERVRRCARLCKSVLVAEKRDAAALALTARPTVFHQPRFYINYFAIRFRGDGGEGGGRLRCGRLGKPFSPGSAFAQRKRNSPNGHFYASSVHSLVSRIFVQKRLPETVHARRRSNG